SDNLPEYEARLEAMSGGGLAWLESQGIEVSTDSLLAQVDASQAADLAGAMVASIGSLLSNTAFVLITTVFILAEAAGFPRKLKLVLSDGEGGLQRFDGIIRDIQEYLSIKTKISL